MTSTNSSPNFGGVFGGVFGSRGATGVAESGDKFASAAVNVCAQNAPTGEAETGDKTAAAASTASTAVPLILAPMAGLSDLPLRQVAREFGADLTISEMISANALVYESEKSRKMLTRAPAERPFIAQIAGTDLGVIKRAVHILNDAGVDGIDLNCGCPVPKVVRQHAGSALLEDLEHLQAILRLIKRENATGFTSAKIRLGFARPDIARIVPAIAACAPDMLAIHARTRAGMYHAAPDYSQIALAKRLAPEQFIAANGDISAANAAQVLALTGANALMIGRAAVGKPWEFLAIRRALESAQPAQISLTDSEKRRIIARHFAAMCEFYGEARACAIFRKHMHEYSKGSAAASALRCAANEAKTPAAMEQIIANLHWKGPL